MCFCVLARWTNAMESTFHPGVAGANCRSPCNASGRPYSAAGHDFGARRIFSDRHCCVSIELQRSVIRGSAGAALSYYFEMN
jgi:hypothetical protein|tara:strand:+ start:643 stop:888 length:246 start_codon:yes stop_codon:yes gene_type:complete